MKLAIIGYGKMGKIIESLAIERGHDIVAILDKQNASDVNSEKFAQADAAIEFTEPESALDNFLACFRQNVPVVSGTTGWLDMYETVVQECKKQNGAFFYASNFSIGVNILFEMNRKLASLMDRFPQYKAMIEETHHIHKLDAPSGTAISLAKDLVLENSKLHSWKRSEDKPDENSLPVKSLREGEVFGEHAVQYESDVDIIELKHKAKNRKGFALGAIMAAEFIQNKKGIFSMKDMLSI
ncbi:MAG: 4-hydroxy-tetrahydrodipicolinate reductase [Bacteroidales bacterium]